MAVGGSLVTRRRSVTLPCKVVACVTGCVTGGLCNWLCNWLRAQLFRQLSVLQHTGVGAAALQALLSESIDRLAVPVTTLQHACNCTNKTAPAAYMGGAAVTNLAVQHWPNVYSGS